MKLSTNIIVLLAMTTALFLSCNVHSVRLLRIAKDGEVKVTQGKIHQPSNTIEFRVDWTYDSRNIKRYDSLQLQIFINDGKKDLYLGAITDTNLRQKPFTRKLTKTFQTKVTSGKAYDEVVVSPVIYKNELYSKGQRLAIASVTNFK